MKANEAPEKLYLSDFTDTTESVFYVKQDNTKKTDIEYIRKDAFVEKTINFFEMLGYGFTITDNITHTNYDKEQLVEDFKNYMKGE